MATRIDSLPEMPATVESRWSLGRLLRRLRKEPIQESGLTLQSVGADLRQLNRGTESDFLAAGEELSTILATERLVSEDLQHLAQAFSAENGERSIQALGRMRVHFQRVEESIRSGHGTFLAVREAGNDVGKALSGLERVLPELRAVGTATKIEAARLGAIGSDFATVADEVNRLTQQIGVDVRSVVEAAEALHERIDGAVRLLGELGEKQIHELPAAVASLAQAIERMHEGESRALGVTEQARLESVAVEESISRLVTQLQFHDITRQQIEHVIEAVEALGRARAGAAAATLAIQVSQLDNASATYHRSLAEIASELGMIMRRVARMAGFCRDFFDSGTAHESLFLSVEESLTRVLASYTECEKSEQTMSHSARELAATLRQMRETAASVDSIDVRMQRVALNATIRAAHIGSRGQALGVLADSIHTLAQACGARAAAVVRLIEKMIGLAELLDSGPATSAEGDAGDSRQVSAALNEMHSASESAYARLQRVQSLCARLETGVGELRERFVSADSFTSSVAAAVKSLEEIAGAETAEASGATPPAEVAHLSSAYTMEREREIHALATGARRPAQAPAAPPAAVPAADGGEFGDNVELF